MGGGVKGVLESCFSLRFLRPFVEVLEDTEVRKEGFVSKRGVRSLVLWKVIGVSESSVSGFDFVHSSFALKFRSRIASRQASKAT